MKKCILLLIASLFVVNATFAEWQPDDKAYTRLDKEGSTWQRSMKSVRTSDGKIVFTWVRTEILNGYESGVLHMQIFDADGNAQFGDEGIIVCNKPTESYTVEYGLALASNGDILIAFQDSRIDPDKLEYAKMYFYRYDQQGNPVWDADGLSLTALPQHDNTISVEEDGSTLCVGTDGQIYAAVRQTEYVQRENVEIEVNWLVLAINDDGTTTDAEPVVLPAKAVILHPAPGGDMFVIFDGDFENKGYEAQRIDRNLNTKWAVPTIIEAETQNEGGIIHMPIVETTADGGVVMCYRKLIKVESRGIWSLNYMTPDGEVLDGSVPFNISNDGDSYLGVMALRGNDVFTSWEIYGNHKYTLYANMMDIYGNKKWTGDAEDGLILGEMPEIDYDEMKWNFGYKPVKVIPVEDGWVLLYGICTDYNAANFMLAKFDDDGNTIWTRQICEDNFNSTGFSICSDDKNAYIFFTQDVEVDEDQKVIPGTGGIFVMCVSITDKEPTAIDEVPIEGSIVGTKVYTVDGQRVSQPRQGINIVCTTDENGVKTVKKVLKR